MTIETLTAQLQAILQIHESDPNFPAPVLNKIHQYFDSDAAADPDAHDELIRELRLEAALVASNSPYAEVRSVVVNHDDPQMPVSTVRAWTIGAAMAIILPFVNVLFLVHKPSINLGVYVAQVLAWPLGKLWERFVPHVHILGVDLNPGPLTKKEHMLITIMANSARTGPYSLDIVYIQFLPNFLDQAWAGNFGYQVVGALATNFVGYGMAGLVRSLLVYPAYCIWPETLVIIALNAAFHGHDDGAVHGPFGSIWHVSRYRLFLCAFAAMFVWYFFPGYIFTALSSFSWISWIAPGNRDLDIVTGMNSGAGLNPWPTFDWAVTSVNGNPLVLPFFTTLNRAIGTFIGFPIVLALWYRNAFYTGYLPLVAATVFDNTGATYNITRATNAEGTFDAAKYASYSPAYMSAGNVVSYIFFFALYPATLLYTLLRHRRAIQASLGLVRNAKTQYTDVHRRMMAAYAEGALLLSSFDHC
jgi:OPT family small oligopeptide transporter